MNKIKKVTDILLILAVFLPFTNFKLLGYLSMFILLYLLCIFLFRAKNILIDKKLLTIPLLLTLTLLSSGVAELFGVNRNFNNSIFDSLQRISIVLLFVIIISNVKKNDLLSTFYNLLKNTFIIGFICLLFMIFTGEDLINENAVAFLLLPYLGYLVITSGLWWKKLLFFLVGLLLLYLSNGRASLMAFLLTPIFWVIINRPILKVLLFSSISIGVTCWIFYMGDDLLKFDELLSRRATIQIVYINEIIKDGFSLLFGSGEYTILQSQDIRLGAHQSWLGIIWMYGIVGFLANFIIIIYSLRAKVKKEEMYLHLIAIYILVIQLFEVVNLGGISYLSLLLLISLILPLKDEKCLAKVGN